MRWRTPGPVSPRSLNGRAPYHPPSASQTSPPINRAKANRSASRPVTSSSSFFSFFTRGWRSATSRNDGHSTSRCFPRSSLCTVPGGNRSPSAAQSAAAPHRDAGSLSATASSSTSSFATFGGDVVPAPPFPSPARFPSLGASKTSPTARNVSPSRANHPTVSMLGANRTTPVAETAPCVGRKPKTPQCAAGTRTLPLSPSRARRPRPSARPRPRPPSRWTSPPGCAPARPGFAVSRNARSRRRRRTRTRPCASPRRTSRRRPRASRPLARSCPRACASPPTRASRNP